MQNLDYFIAREMTHILSIRLSNALRMDLTLAKDLPRFENGEGFGRILCCFLQFKVWRRVKVQPLTKDGRANLVVAADYREGRSIEVAVKAVINRVEATARIHRVK